MPKSENKDLYFKLGEMHADIKNTYEETRKTNGRVTKLETETVPALRKEVSDGLNEVRMKVAYFSGGFAVVMWIIEKVVAKYF